MENVLQDNKRCYDKILSDWNFRLPSLGFKCILVGLMNMIDGMQLVHFKDDPRCVCGHLLENAIHFFLECPLYQHNRTSLFNYFNNIVPISIEYILFGCNEIREELNTLLFKSVQY
jgi:hypothetical protein